MKTRLIEECPRYTESECRDKDGRPVVICSRCDLAKKRGEVCRLADGSKWADKARVILGIGREEKRQ